MRSSCIGYFCKLIDIELEHASITYVQRSKTRIDADGMLLIDQPSRQERPMIGDEPTSKVMITKRR